MKWLRDYVKVALCILISGVWQRMRSWIHELRIRLHVLAASSWVKGFFVPLLPSASFEKIKDVPPLFLLEQFACLLFASQQDQQDMPKLLEFALLE
jgi:hypothetical protein